MASGRAAEADDDDDGSSGTGLRSGRAKKQKGSPTRMCPRLALQLVSHGRTVHVTIAWNLEVRQPSTKSRRQVKKGADADGKILTSKSKASEMYHGNFEFEPIEWSEDEPSSVFSVYDELYSHLLAESAAGNGGGQRCTGCSTVGIVDGVHLLAVVYAAVVFVQSRVDGQTRHLPLA
jgi:hypothetical protein